jgi:hypothetical protein
MTVSRYEPGGSFRYTVSADHWRRIAKKDMAPDKQS